MTSSVRTRRRPGRWKFRVRGVLGRVNVFRFSPAHFSLLSTTHPATPVFLLIRGTTLARLNERVRYCRTGRNGRAA